LREIFKNTSTKNINPTQMHPMIFPHEKPDEASSIELPLYKSIMPANVQMIAASNKRVRFETQKIEYFDKFILFILKKEPYIYSKALFFQ